MANILFPILRLYSAILQPRFLWLLLPLIVSLFSCGDFPPCDQALVYNAKYRVSIVEKYDQNSSAKFDSKYTLQGTSNTQSCGALDGFESGKSFSIKASIKRNTGNCYYLKSEILALPNGSKWKLSAAPDVYAGMFSNCVEITYAIGAFSNSGCSGTYEMVLCQPSQSSSPFLQNDSGALPSAVMGRSFSPNQSAVGCSYCMDNYVVWLAEQP